MNEQKNTFEGFDFDSGTTSSNLQKDYLKKKEKQKYGQRNRLMMFLDVVLVLLLILVFYYNRYISLISQDEVLTDEQSTFVQDFKSTKDEYLGYIGISSQEDVSLDIDLDKTDAKDISTQLNDYVYQNDSSYIDKKQNISDFIKGFVDTIKSNDKMIEKIKSDIGVYGFLPQQIDTIVSDNSLQRSILSIEAIKFYTALEIFGKLDSFVSNFSSFVGVNADAANKKLDYYSSRGEVDIQRFLVDCYLNPFEVGQKCERFGDFDIFYNSTKDQDLRKNFDPAFFKNLMVYLEQNLESDTLPKLSIVMNSFDPTKNKISFSIEMNTFQEDEASLMRKNILNPHIYMTSIMLGLLRKSSFILGDELKLDGLQVNKVPMNIGNNQVIVNNSRFTFDVPVQDSVQREIYDYVYQN